MTLTHEQADELKITAECAINDLQSLSALSSLAETVARNMEIPHAMKRSRIDRDRLRALAGGIDVMADMIGGRMTELVDLIEELRE